MATVLGKRKASGLRTYSRRANSFPNETPSKKRRVEEILNLDSPSHPIGSSSPPRNISRSSIQSYFKPIPICSSPQSTRSTIQSSDSIEPLDLETPQTTPPSSPPAIKIASPLPLSKISQKRPRRRLTTRPILPPEPKMERSGRDKALNYMGPVINEEDRPIHYKVHERQKAARRESVAGRAWSGVMKGLGITINAESPHTAPSSPSESLVDEDPEAAAPGTIDPKTKHKKSYKSWQSSTPPPLTKPTRVLRPDLSWEPYPEGIDPDLPSAAIDIPKPKKLVQANLDFGQTPVVICKKCEMHYNSADRKERKDHENYCNLYNVPLLSRKDILDACFYWENVVEGIIHRIRVFTPSSTAKELILAEKILDQTYFELDGLRYSSEDLWSRITNPSNPTDPNLVPRFKLYCYYIGPKVVAVILAEQYSDALTIQELGGDESISAGKKIVVFDRIWVDIKNRHDGLAFKLADVVRGDFMPGVNIEKKQAAMSQTTLLGTLWAEKYFQAIKQIE